MAGIGFELRKLVDREDYTGLILGYGFAGMLASGPWILSTMGVLLVALLALGLTGSTTVVVDFLVSVTYLMAFSLITTGCVQFFFTRFLADRLYEKREEVVLPNLFGVLSLMTGLAGTLGAIALALLFTRESVGYRLIMLGNFVVLCDMWIAVIFVSCLKEFKWVLGAFLAGYATTVAACLALSLDSLHLGREGLLAGFLIGHCVLLFSLLALIVRQHPGNGFIRFDFLKRGQSFYLLCVTGLVFNIGFWSDKILFWLNPNTSHQSVGPLRYSIIYDLPIFLASLSIIPGTAVFLLRIEADFAEKWKRFYDAIDEGKSLQELEHFKDEMVATIRQGIYELFKVQSLVVAFCVLNGPAILEACGISPHAVHLFRVAVVGFGLLVLMLAVLNVLFYLDKRVFSLALLGLFLVANVTLTIVSQRLGPPFYGYGFTLAAFLTLAVGLVALSRKLDWHEYETFMLQ